MGNLWLVLPVLLAAGGNDPPLDPARLGEVAAMLRERPHGVGPTHTDRAAWSRLAAHPSLAGVIGAAEQILSRPLPEQPDELYLEYSRTGNRTRWQAVAAERRGRVARLALAECLEDQGRFLPALETVLRALCAERTWVMPAHDGNLANFEGRSITIDLGAAHVAGDLGMVDHLLGDRLDPEVRRLVRENLERRILAPYVAGITGQAARQYWLTTTNNWNAVCLAGVSAAALTQLESRQERARVIVAAEHYVRYFLRGFTPDGYCSEGTGYWNYGFGQFVILAETVRQATGGGVDLLADPAARAPAEFGSKITILDGVCPAFADCGITARPDGRTMWFVNRALKLGQPGGEGDGIDPGGNLYHSAVYCHPNAASTTPPVPGAAGDPPPRTWFDAAGIYLGRPAPGSDSRFAVALKGGHNAEHHNHNDVGSYVVVVDGAPVLLDPGAETYSARTFSARRYDSNLLNSFGHPVPRVGGQLQRPGGEARAKVLAAEFTDAADRIALDLGACYAVPSLRELTREFVYDRAQQRFTVTDTVEFSEAQAFGTALLTAGEWQAAGPGRLVVTYEAGAVEVAIAASAPYDLVAEQIHEDAPVLPTRLGLNLREPVTRATITLTIAPARELLDDPALLRNGGFERGRWGWVIADGMSTISDERASAGSRSLKIDDAATDAGSSVTSTPVALEPGRAYALSGQVYHQAGGGVGLYVRCYNAAGELVSQHDERGNETPLGTLEGPLGQWAEFRYTFTPPPGTATGRIWIHSYNGSRVTAFLDELAVAPL